MEYPSSNDYYLKFNALSSNNGLGKDYILDKISSNFTKATNIKKECILGKKLSEIISEYENNIIGLKEIYDSTIPKTGKKFEKYIKEKDKWYIINLFSDEKNNVLVFYNDITRIKESGIMTEKKIKDESSKPEKSLISYRDKMTGLYNADFFYEELKRLDSQRQLPINIIMGDLNGLKLINDAFGHIMGDKVLIRVAEIMKKVFRKEDIISRAGGDEFLILLPKTSRDTALQILERIKTECKNNPLDFIQISISFGLATKESKDVNLIDLYKKAESNMYHNKLAESKAAKLSIIKFLTHKLEKETTETIAHFERLNKLSQLVGNALNIPEIEKRRLKLLCQYHDVGTVAIPIEILNKKDALNKNEWEIVKGHCESGYHIITAFRETLVIDELILMHHERWDGRGYPRNIKGKDIPEVVRIFSIADAYESMVNDRPYRNKMTCTQALKVIEAEAGKQFDPDMAALFINIMEKGHAKAI